MALLDQSRGLRLRLGFWPEVLGGVAVFVLGLVMLRDKLPWLAFS
jgi:hypothetical protein